MYMLHCDKRVVFVCKLQIYIKNIAKACVVRSLKIPQQTRMCLVGKPKKISFFFPLQLTFWFSVLCCLLFRLLPEPWTSSREWWQPSGTQRWMSRLQRLKLHLALKFNMRRLRAKFNSCYLHAQHEHLRTQTQKGRKKQAYTQTLPEKQNNDFKIILLYINNKIGHSI